MDAYHNPTRQLHVLRSTKMQRSSSQVNVQRGWSQQACENLGHSFGKKWRPDKKALYVVSCSILNVDVTLNSIVRLKVPLPVKALTWQLRSNARPLNTNGPSASFHVCPDSDERSNVRTLSHRASAASICAVQRVFIYYLQIDRMRDVPRVNIHSMHEDRRCKCWPSGLSSQVKLFAKDQLCQSLIHL